MFDRVSDKEVTEAIETVIASLGVREEVSCGDLPRFLRKKDTQGCVQEIASRLGLPVRIELSYVPKDFSPDNPNRFESSSLAHTDWRGRGIEELWSRVVYDRLGSGLLHAVDEHHSLDHLGQEFVSIQSSPSLLRAAA